MFPNAGFKMDIIFSNNTIKFSSNIRRTINGLIDDPKIQFKEGYDYLFHI
jgi:hypothetical protein